MLTRAELGRAAAKMGMPLGQAEHEYAILCVLDGLAQAPLLGDTFCLKGGTALRQLYYADWRHSVDLDFSVLPAFSAADLRHDLERWFARVGALHGLQLSPLSIHIPNGAARVRARFIGPLQHPSRLLFDLTFDEPVLLPPQRRGIVVGLFPEPNPYVLAYVLEELLAEKLRAILERGKSRDYYDVWRLLKEKHEDLDLGTVREVFAQKCAHKGLVVPGPSGFFVPRVLEAAEAYWQRDLSEQVPGGDLPPWRQVVDELARLLGAFLEGMPRGSAGERTRDAQDC